MNLPSHFGSGFVYFFSSFKNISSIAEHGHFSREEAASNINIEWEDIAPRGELIGSRKGIEGFISLYFGTHTATQFRHEQDEKKIAFIRYDADELFQREGAWFTEIAYQISKERWQCNALSENLEKLDWSLINSKERGFRSSKHPSRESLNGRVHKQSCCSKTKSNPQEFLTSFLFLRNKKMNFYQCMVHHMTSLMNR